MQNFEIIEDTVSIKSILKKMSILKSILSAVEISEKQKSVLGELLLQSGSDFERRCVRCSSLESLHGS